MSKEHALRRWIIAERINQTEAASRFGISNGYLSEMIADKKHPSGSLLRRIVRETNGVVGFEDFNYPEQAATG